MSAGNLTDEDLRYVLTLLGSSAKDEALRSKINEDLPPPPVHALELKLVNPAEVEVADAPEGKTVDAALCIDAASSDGKPLTEPKGLKVGDRIKGKAGHEWVDAHVHEDPVWWSKDHGRIKVTVAAPVEEPKEEPKPPPTGALRVGWAGGGWGGQDITDAKAGGQTAVRLENPSSISAYKSAGLDVLWLANHYNEGGVKALNRSEILNRVRIAVAAGAWVVEVLNEPGGDWFWGAGALSEANARVMGELLLEAHAAAPGAKLLASWDGGHAGGGEWGKLVLKTTPSLKGQSWLRWSVHPYAGSSADPSATKLNPPSGLCVHLPTIDACHAATGCNVIPSELGFPTLSSTGDSPKCTEAQQKLAHELSLRYCRERPYVEGYFGFGYRDGDGAKGYGLVRKDGTKKPAYSVLHP